MENTFNDQKKSFFYRLLATPQLYRLSQNIFNKNKAYKALINEYLQPTDGDKILDIGCGTACIVDFIPPKVSYVGFDLNSRYIEYAQNKYKDRVRLYAKRVGEAESNSFEKFDHVIAIGIVHHISDEESIKLFQLGYDLLKPGGKMITYDPTINIEDNLIAKWMTRNDRGEHIRYPNDYKVIAEKVFDSTEIHVRKDLLNVAQSICITIGRKK